MMPNKPENETEMSAVECVQNMYDMLKEQNFSEEVLNNAHQLVKKVQAEDKNLSNVKHMDEETPEEDVTEEPSDETEEDMPDYSKMSQDEMGQHMKKKGIISITIGVGPKK